MPDTTVENTNDNQQRTRGEDRRKGERRKVLVGQRKPDRGSAEVTVRKKDGVVQAIVVTCPCGEEILVDCVYSD